MTPVVRGQHLVFRADAGPDQGTGHVMRCLALAQGWIHGGGQATLVAGGTNQGMRQRLALAGVQTVLLEDTGSTQEHLAATLSCLEKNGACWLVTDGYHFGPDYQRQVKEAGYRLLAVDDIASSPHYYADILVNQNLNACHLDYSTEDYTCRLLGPGYALLRGEFLRWREWRRCTSDLARRVLVTIGGSDPCNYTLKVLEVLRRTHLQDLEVMAVIGALNPYRDALEAEVQAWNPEAVQLPEDVADMSGLMAWADLGITAGGTTCWELAFMGLPTITLITHENHLATAPGLESLGITRKLDVRQDLPEGELAQLTSELVVDYQSRCCMSVRGRELVDGLGAARVVGCMGEVSIA